MEKIIRKTDWGKIYYFNADKYKFALYVYDDDPTTIYLSNVKVFETFRGIGLGDQILEESEKQAKEINPEINSICLLCQKISWKHEWYNRHGYKDLCDDKDNSSFKYIWLKKDI